MSFEGSNDLNCANYFSFCLVLCKQHDLNSVHSPFYFTGTRYLLFFVWLINQHNLEQNMQMRQCVTTVCKVKVGQDNVKHMFLIILMGKNELNISTQEIRFRNVESSTYLLTNSLIDTTHYVLNIKSIVLVSI